MGMQVTSLTGGANIPIPGQKEQKPQPVLPVERKLASANSDTRGEVQADAFIPGSQKSQAPELRETVSNLEKISLAFDRRLQFLIDQDSHQIIVKVIDNETDKVIRVLPPEELQRVHSKIKETMGFLFDRMV